MSIANKFIDRVAPLLSITIGGIRTATSHLTPQDDWVERVKRPLAVTADKVTRPLGRPLITEVSDADYVCTAETDSDEVEVELTKRYQRNFTSTRKYRVIDGKRQWADGSWVHDPDDTEWQHHVYLFDHPDGGTDVYGHKEPLTKMDSFGLFIDSVKT